MSQSVFPSFPGLAWPVTRKPVFNTVTKRSVSGNEIRVAHQQYPLYEFGLSYEFLQAASIGDLQKLLAFFLLMRGSFDSFLFTDQLDYSVTAGSFGSGDGTTVAFQLVRSFNGGAFSFVEPVENVNTITAININGVPTTNYVVGDTGIITFTEPPGAGLLLTWTGTFYYRCRFSDDSTEFTNFAKDLWQVQQLSFVGATGNKV